MYYSTGTLGRFLSNFKKICKKLNFGRNQLKLATRHKNMYMYEKKIIKIENSPGANFDKIPCTIFGLVFEANFKN